MSSSILLLMEDGEMHSFVSGVAGVPGVSTVAGGSGVASSGPGSIVLTRGGFGIGESVLVGAPGDPVEGATSGGMSGLGLGSHFLTHDPTADRVTHALDAGTTGGNTAGIGIPKVEVDPMATLAVPIEVVVEKPLLEDPTSGRESLKGNADKKVCLLPLNDGTTCGKTFAKYDAFKRHLGETHKATGNSGLSPLGTGGISRSKANVFSQPSIQIVQVQSSSPGKGSHPMHLVSSGQQTSNPLHIPNPLPFLNLNGSLPTSNKPLGSKVCRWVQNDGTVCGKAFSKLDSLRRHVNELHKGVRPFTCNLCDKCYGRRDYLDRHTRTHSKKQKSGPASSSDSTTIDWGPTGVLLQGDETPVPQPPKVPKKKRKDIPPEEKKICLWVMEDGNACGKTFTKFDSLKRHVSEAHKGIRPYTCSLCGKSYGRRDYLLRHLKSHNDAEVANLNISKMTSSEVQQLSENSCSPGSLHPTSINFSTLVPHAPPALSGIINSPPLPSHTLSQSQSSSSSSIRPIKTAQNAKKRAAEDKKTCKWVLENGTVCGRTFSKFDSLRRHVTELHKGIRPFVCQRCEKTYGRKDYLDRHMKSHEEEDDEVLHESLITAMKTDGDPAAVGMDVDDDDEGEEQVILSNVVTVVGGSVPS